MQSNNRVQCIDGSCATRPIYSKKEQTLSDVPNSCINEIIGSFVLGIYVVFFGTCVDPMQRNGKKKSGP